MPVLSHTRGSAHEGQTPTRSRWQDEEEDGRKRHWPLGVTLKLSPEGESAFARRREGPGQQMQHREVVRNVGTAKDKPYDLERVVCPRGVGGGVSQAARLKPERSDSWVR